MKYSLAGCERVQDNHPKIKHHDKTLSLHIPIYSGGNYSADYRNITFQSAVFFCPAC